MRTATLETVGHGLAGLRQKVARIRALVEAAKRKPDFRARAASIVAHVGEKDHDGEIAAVTDFVRSRIRYLRDPWSPVGLEVFTAPWTMLEDVDAGSAAGDCDDHVLLASGLLEVIGYETRYRVGGDAPGRYRHIWLDVKHPRRGWRAIELTAKRQPLDFDPSPRFAVVETLGEGAQDDTMSRLPPSVANLPSQPIDPLFAGATPSDFFRYVEGEAVLGEYESEQDGLGKFKLKKLRKKLKKFSPVHRLKKRIKTLPKRLKKATRAVSKIGKVFKKKKRRGDPVGPDEMPAEPTETGIPAGEVPPGGYDLMPDAPAPEQGDASGTPFAAVSGGFAAPSAAMDSTSYTDEPPPMDLPATGEGSYFPTPDDFPPEGGAGFDEPAGDDGGSFAPEFMEPQGGFDPTMDNLGSFKNLLQSGAQAALDYQRAKLQQKTVARGFGLVPTWVWPAVIGGGVLVFIMLRRRR